MFFLQAQFLRFRFLIVLRVRHVAAKINRSNLDWSGSVPVSHAKVVASRNHRSGGSCQPPIKKSGACQRIGSSSMSIV
jgi:hypothetical protein